MRNPDCNAEQFLLSRAVVFCFAWRFATLRCLEKKHFSAPAVVGRLIVVHLQCRERLPFLPFRVRQRSGEGVVRRNGCPKGCFWRVRFFSALLRFILKSTCKVLKTLRGQSRNGLSKNTLLDNRFSARRLRRSLGAPPLLFSVYKNPMP